MNLRLIIFIVCASARLLASAQTFKDWTPTPPLGWNSFDCYGETVTEQEVRQHAEWMAKHLRNLGYEYVVADIRWYDAYRDNSHVYNTIPATYDVDAYGRLLPDAGRWPSSEGGTTLRPLIDYVHSLGLKFGLHLMRGIPRLAVERNTPIAGTPYTARDIYDEGNACTWLADMWGVDPAKPGAQEWYNSVFDLYAAWGLDFVKIDDLSFPYQTGEIELIRKAIDQCGRPIVLSASPGDTPLAEAAHVTQHANMWRVIGDLWDEWGRLKHLFDVCPGWMPHIGNGTWPDADMLPLGRIGLRAEMGEDRDPNLTRDEQRLMMTLMAMMRSPLMLGGILPRTDKWTRSLIANPEVLRIDQHSANNRQLFRRGDLAAWAADDPETGDWWLAVFNVQDQVPVIESKALWHGEPLSDISGKRSQTVDVALPQGTERIWLYVSDGGNGTFFDHADWIEPRLTGPAGTLRLSERKWVSATTGWGEVQRGKSVSEAALSVDGVEYAEGLGVHAASLIEFKVPKGYDRFTATVGLDKGCEGHVDGASVQFHIFAQDPAGPAPAQQEAVPVPLPEGQWQVTDVWTGKAVGTYTGEFAPVLKPHQAGLYRMSRLGD